MKRQAILAAALGLLVVGCQPQSEFDRCMEVGTAIVRELSVRTGSDDDEDTALLAKAEAWEACAGRRK